MVQKLYYKNLIHTMKKLNKLKKKSQFGKKLKGRKVFFLLNMILIKKKKEISENYFEMNNIYFNF